MNSNDLNVQKLNDAEVKIYILCSKTNLKFETKKADSQSLPCTSND